MPPYFTLNMNYSLLSSLSEFVVRSYFLWAAGEDFGRISFRLKNGVCNGVIGRLAIVLLSLGAELGRLGVAVCKNRSFHPCTTALCVPLKTGDAAGVSGKQL